jgi:transposase-like protein
VKGSGHGEKFSRRMKAAIVALLEQPTIPEAAKAAGVSYTSLWRWLQEFTRGAKSASLACS